jgi:hypothetical protein
MLCKSSCRDDNVMTNSGTTSEKLVVIQLEKGSPIFYDSEGSLCPLEVGQKIFSVVLRVVE